jgi:hypothetical protein
MTHTYLDWTHKGTIITDIRKLNKSKLYVIKVIDGETSVQIDSALFVRDIIFEERLKSYFIKDISRISREEILAVKWNMYITKGYYIKINKMGVVDEFKHDPDKWYISYLEIDGPLGLFTSIFRENDEETK